MTAPTAWLEQPFALVHGEDGDGRREAVEAWKRKHVDPEWADFTLTVCSEGCPWPEVIAALQEAAPLGAEARAVILPAADNLFSKRRGAAKDKKQDLPEPVAALLQHPPQGVKLLIVAWNTIPAGPGNPLGSKPWTDWAKAGRILKVGALEPAEIGGFLQEEARRFGLQLQPEAAEMLKERLGGNVGIIKRAMEVFDLASERRVVSPALVEVMTYRMTDQRVFAWSEAWQKGQLAQALKILKECQEDDFEKSSLMLVGQAARELGRVAALAQAMAFGVKKESELAQAVQLPPNQAWLLGRTYLPTATRMGLTRARDLFRQVVQCERDIKGTALSKSPTPLADLTVRLCREWNR
ncbi:MAG: DNA polymerase III subunit delta [Geothrix sp.]|nr:DNA polymerase III subunit delta [Geothrix sp.]